MSRHVHIDLCSGTGALGLSLFGAKPLCTQHGNKQRYTHAVKALTGWTAPDLLVMVDAGPWPTALAVLNDPVKREAVLVKMRAYCGCPIVELRKWLASEPVPKDEILFVARFLTLMRTSYHGKAVGTDGSRWNEHGICYTSANGVSKPGFGTVKPQLPQMVKRIERHPHLPLHCIRGDVREFDPATVLQAGDRMTWTFDPPYDCTTGYAAGLSRADVLGVAETMGRSGEGLTHEQEALPLAGWEAMPIGQWRKGRRSAMQTPEWVTCTPGLLRWLHDSPVQALLFGEAA